MVKNANCQILPTKQDTQHSLNASAHQIVSLFLKRNILWTHLISLMIER